MRLMHCSSKSESSKWILGLTRGRSDTWSTYLYKQFALNICRSILSWCPKVKDLIVLLFSFLHSLPAWATSCPSNCEQKVKYYCHYLVIIAPRQFLPTQIWVFKIFFFPRRSGLTSNHFANCNTALKIFFVTMLWNYNWLTNYKVLSNLICWNCAAVASLAAGPWSASKTPSLPGSWAEGRPVRAGPIGCPVSPHISSGLELKEELLRDIIGT